MSANLRRTRTLGTAKRYLKHRDETAAQIKVLIVEDHDDTREMLRT